MIICNIFYDFVCFLSSKVVFSKYVYFLFKCILILTCRFSIYAQIRGALRACNSNLLTVILPQGLGKQVRVTYFQIIPNFTIKPLTLYPKHNIHVLIHLLLIYICKLHWNYLCKPPEMQALLMRVVDLQQSPQFDELDFKEAAAKCNIKVLETNLVFVYKFNAMHLTAANSSLDS